MALKLAIVRVNDDTGETEVLLDLPLRESLEEEARRLARAGFRKRRAKKTVEAHDAVEQKLRDLTVTLQ